VPSIGKEAMVVAFPHMYATGRCVHIFASAAALLHRHLWLNQWGPILEALTPLKSLLWQRYSVSVISASELTQTEKMQNRQLRAGVRSG